MKLKFWKWWTVFNAGIIALVLAEYFYGLTEFLLASDVTYLSFAIIVIAVLFGISVLIGFSNMKSPGAENSTHWFASDVVLNLGMMGTLIGFLIVLGQAFEGIDPSSIDSMTTAITVLATGMSTALTTTLVGLISSVWMKLQLVIIEKQ